MSSALNRQAYDSNNAPPTEDPSVTARLVIPEGSSPGEMRQRLANWAPVYAQLKELFADATVSSLKI